MEGRARNRWTVNVCGGADPDNEGTHGIREIFCVDLHVIEIARAFLVMTEFLSKMVDFQISAVECTSAAHILTAPVEHLHPLSDVAIQAELDANFETCN